MLEYPSLTLTDIELENISMAAQGRQDRAIAAKRRAIGYGSHRTNTLGIIGEYSLAKFLGYPYDMNETLEQEKERGYDIGNEEQHYGVRCTKYQRHGEWQLLLRQSDAEMPYALVIAKYLPVVYFPGYIPLNEGLKYAERGDIGGYLMHFVSIKHLYSWSNSERHS